MSSHRPIAGSGSSWHAFHLYYPGDRDRLLLQVILPVARRLLSRREIESFFFVRYGQEGLHVRLRLQVRQGAEESVAAEVEREAQRFFEARPGSSVRQSPFEPEVERYGGRRYLPASLGLFALSSATILRVLRRLRQTAGSAGRGRLLGVAAETLLRQALGWARDGAELERLLAYGVEQWGKEHPSMSERAAEASDRQQEDLVALTLQEIERRLVLAPSMALGSAQDPLATGSLLLSHILRRLEPARRAYAGWSHLHMTANRLGLRNSEEVHLSALLRSSFEKVKERRPEVMARLDPELRPAGRPSHPVRALSAGLGPVLRGMLDEAEGDS